MNPAKIVALCVAIATAIFWFSRVLLQQTRQRLRAQSKRKRRILLKPLQQQGLTPLIFGFFHPFCNAGGGGERVLWAAIRATLDEHANAFCAVYTGDVEADKRIILRRAQDAFGITLDASRIDIVHLKKRYLVSPETWPRFTLIGQSLGSIPLAYEAIEYLAPDIFIDTMGYAFTYPLVHYLLHIPVGSYTHYPTISTDMLSRVPAIHVAKLIYWKTFAVLYGVVGQYADLIMANSTWTADHLRKLWRSEHIKVVYPPCDTKALTQISITEPRNQEIICLAQFRKEKNHETLIKAFANLLQNVNSSIKDRTRLILIGTVRNDEDRQRVEDLRRLTVELNIASDVSFEIDVPWPIVMKKLSSGSIGTNAMWNEHFGIGVVEYMAAGLIPVVHDSAGPKLDIVTPYDGKPTGFHATDVTSFAFAFEQALSLSEEDCIAWRRRAQASSQRFSEEVFTAAWKQAVVELLRRQRIYSLKVSN